MNHQKEKINTKNWFGLINQYIIQELKYGIGFHHGQTDLMIKISSLNCMVTFSKIKFFKSQKPKQLTGGIKLIINIQKLLMVYLEQMLTH